jgi:methylglutaconyl-CoA hydratase
MTTALEQTNITVIRDEKGVCTVTLNRPEKRNAFDDSIITDLTHTFQDISTDPLTRVLVLRGAGDHFSAGADLAWMKRMVELSYEENVQDARALRNLMESLLSCTKPTIGVVQGAVIGGAIGLIACCDLVTANEGAFFKFSEVLIGLTPAVISPYIVRAIGERASRRYFTTGETFSAHQAHKLGLVNEVQSTQDCEAQVAQWCSDLLAAGPEALRATKDLLAHLRSEARHADTAEFTTTLIADLRVSPEGQEGLTAFLEKRQPRWRH